MYPSDAEESFFPAHQGHCHIQNDGDNLIGPFAIGFDPGLTVFGSQNAVAETLKGSLAHGPHQFLVIDDEYSSRSVKVEVRVFLRGSSGLLRGGGEQDGEGGAVAESALYTNGSAMSANNP